MILLVCKNSHPYVYNFIVEVSQLKGEAAYRGFFTMSYAVYIMRKKFSAGIVTFPDNAKDLKGLILAEDSALRQVKYEVKFC